MMLGGYVNPAAERPAQMCGRGMGIEFNVSRERDGRSQREKETESTSDEFCCANIVGRHADGILVL